MNPNDSEYDAWVAERQKENMGHMSNLHQAATEYLDWIIDHGYGFEAIKDEHGHITVIFNNPDSDISDELDDISQGYDVAPDSVLWAMGEIVLSWQVR